MIGKYNRQDFDVYMVPCFSPAKFIPVKAKGSLVWDQEGKDYIDLAGGVAVNSLGHTNSHLIKALNIQANKLWHVGNYYTTEPALQLAKLLVESTFADKIFLCNSGAEANEAALKLARKYCIKNYGKSKNEIIAFTNSFHGRTLFTVTVGGQPQYSVDYAPLPGGITHLPYNDLHAVIDRISEHTCAVIIEPILGEGGVYPADPIFLQELRCLCDRFKATLIFDEVQTGIGRTGVLYAYQKYGVIPDILTSAKGLGGGFPIGAMLVKEAWAKVFQPGTHGTTFGGNPMASAVASTVISQINKKLLDGVNIRHAWIMKKLNQLNEKYPIFSVIRGLGLLIGAELTNSWHGQSQKLIRIAEECGVILLMAGPNVLRFAPALNISFKDLREGFRRLEIVMMTLST